MILCQLPACLRQGLLSPLEMVRPSRVVQGVGLRRQGQVVLAQHLSFQFPPAHRCPGSVNAAACFFTPVPKLPPLGHQRRRRAEGVRLVRLFLQRDDARVRQSGTSPTRTAISRPWFSNRATRRTDSSAVTRCCRGSASPSVSPSPPTTSGPSPDASRNTFNTCRIRLGLPAGCGPHHPRPELGAAGGGQPSGSVAASGNSGQQKKPAHMDRQGQPSYSMR